MLIYHLKSKCILKGGKSVAFKVKFLGDPILSPPPPIVVPSPFPVGLKRPPVDVPNDLCTLLRGKGGKLVEIALSSLPEAL